MRRHLYIRLFTLLLLSTAYCHLAAAAELKQKTTTAFDRYVAATEARFANELKPGGPFLYIDALKNDDRQKAYAQLKQGEVLVEKLETKAPGVSSDVPDGMVHHWVGLIFIPGVTLAQTLPVVKDYDRRAELYKPDVIASRTVSHHGDDYKMFLRLHQKKFTTVVFNTDYDVHWGAVSATKVFSNSISTRIVEVQDPDKPDGPELPIGTGHGYLWRLNSYWRFEEKDGGVYLQCEAISLTRDIPTGLGWLLKPLVTSIPKQSLNRALGQTRNVVQEEGKKCCKAAQSR
ncbi:MAG TPA: hypothetical protein VKL99_08045 [Candidatus Angelobacter sp.]|nr:hypothetical protein [Candidatus Angelobacter sp.]